LAYVIDLINGFGQYRNAHLNNIKIKVISPFLQRLGQRLILLNREVAFGEETITLSTGASSSAILGCVGCQSCDPANKLR